MIVKNIVKNPKSIYGHKNKKRFITIHETDNQSKGADANAHGRLQQNGYGSSWHYSVDDKRIVQSFEHSAQCWHSGMGRDNGNLNSIAIEICVNSDGNFKKAVENTVWLVKKIMLEENISLSNIVRHFDWSGKNCPRNLINGSKGVTWIDFKNRLSEKSVVKPIPSSGVTVFRLGNKGNAVKVFQQKLIKLGYKMSPYGADGSYGKTTEKAVRSFQKEYRLLVDGIAGKQTQNKIDELLKVVSVAKPSPKKTLTEDGKWGNATTKRLQQYLGTKADGYISGQIAGSITNSLYGRVDFGKGGSSVIVALQKHIGAKAHGDLDRKTIIRLQKYLGTKIDGVLSRPSKVVEAMQKALNKNTF